MWILNRYIDVCDLICTDLNGSYMDLFTNLMNAGFLNAAQVAHLLFGTGLPRILS